VGGSREPYSWWAETTNIYRIANMNVKGGEDPTAPRTFKTLTHPNNSTHYITDYKVYGVLCLSLLRGLWSLGAMPIINTTWVRPILIL
jgi:hypothetical protein